MDESNKKPTTISITGQEVEKLFRTLTQVLEHQLEHQERLEASGKGVVEALEKVVEVLGRVEGKLDKIHTEVEHVGSATQSFTKIASGLLFVFGGYGTLARGTYKTALTLANGLLKKMSHERHVEHVAQRTPAPAPAPEGGFKDQQTRPQRHDRRQGRSERKQELRASLEERLEAKGETVPDLEVKVEQQEPAKDQPAP